MCPEFPNLNLTCFVAPNLRNLLRGQGVATVGTWASRVRILPPSRLSRMCVARLCVFSHKPRQQSELFARFFFTTDAKFAGRAAQATKAGKASKAAKVF